MNYDIYGKKLADMRQFGLKAPEHLIGQITANNTTIARIGATITANNKQLPVIITKVIRRNNNEEKV